MMHDSSNLSFTDEADDFSLFLEGAHRIPRAAGRWIGGFMMLAQSHCFFQRPHIWLPPRVEGAERRARAARVYFSAWSQNSISAISGMRGWYYSGHDGDVFARYCGDLVRPFAGDSVRWAFSGAKTRAAFDDAKEAIEWLRRQLG